MRITHTPSKEVENLRKHRLSLAIAKYLFQDLLLLTVHDRFENGEDRWHAIGQVGGKCLLRVFSYPDPDGDENWIRAISLREATPHERRRYEEGGYD